MWNIPSTKTIDLPIAQEITLLINDLSSSIHTMTLFPNNTAIKD